MPFTHFYSDPHFGHANIIKHAGRPFADVDEMDAALIARYRAAVLPNDYVLWLGDCTWKPAQLPGVLASLPGRKALVIGNHDGKHRRMAACGFEFVADRLWLDLDGIPAIACHYPPRSTKRTPARHDTRFVDRMPDLGSGEIAIHGHTHESKAVVDRQKRVHVGVDAWDFAPAPWGAVAGLAHVQMKGGAR